MKCKALPSTHLSDYLYFDIRQWNDMNDDCDATVIDFSKDDHNYNEKCNDSFI